MSRLTMPNVKTRAYIYRVLTAAAPLAGLYGIASDTELVLWLALAATILGTGLAAANTTPPQTRNDAGQMAVTYALCIIGCVVVGAALYDLLLANHIG